MPRRLLARSLRAVAIGLMMVGAAFGIPIIIDPPPRDRSEESQEAEGRNSRPKRRNQRRS